MNNDIEQVQILQQFWDRLLVEAFLYHKDASLASLGNAFHARFGKFPNQCELKRCCYYFHIRMTITVFMSSNLKKLANYLWTVKPKDKAAALEKVLKALDKSSMTSHYKSTFPRKDVNEANKDITRYTLIQRNFGINQVMLQVPIRYKMHSFLIGK